MVGVQNYHKTQRSCIHITTSYLYSHLMNTLFTACTRTSPVPACVSRSVDHSHSTRRPRPAGTVSRVQAYHPTSLVRGSLSGASPEHSDRCAHRPSGGSLRAVHGSRHARAPRVPTVAACSRTRSGRHAHARARPPARPIARCAMALCVRTQTRASDTHVMGAQNIHRRVSRGPDTTASPSRQMLN